jgi:type IV secretory pathway VirB2 component (pilin)
VYHKPLAVLVGIIVVVHVGIAWYFGYAYPMR